MANRSTKKPGKDSYTKPMHRESYNLSVENSLGNIASYIEGDLRLGQAHQRGAD